MPMLQLLKKPKIPTTILLCLIVAYTIYFSWYTINRHDSLNSYAADLSLIDQPMWNTARGPGSFMEQTWGNRQQPRLAEHFEPILLPVALLFWLWDDVRIILIAQSIALAVGALPVFWIARRQFTQIKYNASGNYQSSIPYWSALVFALAYLLYPQLQAANIADFHADPLVVAPLLFAFWYAAEKRWGWMWVWAIVAMATKETLPTLTAMLGLYLIFDFYRSQTAKKGQTLIANPSTALRTGLQSLITNRQSSTSQGLALFVVSVFWFLIATFLIVAPLARQYFGTDGPIYLANRYNDGLAGLPALLQDPARWRYLAGLFAAVGFLPLLAPEFLILGLPVLLANLLSNFPGQYSGEQHYSAPLVVAFIIAAIYGARRMVEKISLREINDQPLKIATLIGATLWILAWSLSYHALHGWTPLSIRMETYTIGPAARQLADYLNEIPPDAVVSASAGIHPHLAHRRVAYVFPTVEDAEYLLVDVTDIPGVHPNDAKAKIVNLLESNWQLRQADQGLILAEKSATASVSDTQLTDTFFDFARATTLPDHITNLAFGDGGLRLLGYDIQDDPDDGVTVRFYWQAMDDLSAELHFWPLIYNDAGQLLSDPTQVPAITTVWYTPDRWRINEIVVTETLPQLMPATFHVGIAVGPEGSFNDPSRRYPVQQITSVSDKDTHDMEQQTKTTYRLQPGQWVQLATLKRQGSFLEHLPVTPSLQALTPIDVQLGSDIHLTGFWVGEEPLEPGTNLPLVLRWVADQAITTDFTVFVHLLAPDGTLIAQSDAFPTWLTPTPTSQWSPHQPFFDRHTLSLPTNLPAGLYTLKLGLYHSQTSERLPLADGGDAISLTPIRVE